MREADFRVVDFLVHELRYHVPRYFPDLSRRSVVDAALGCPPRAGVGFVGEHPMAGSERSGLEASDPDLFKGGLALLTPTAGTPESAVAAATALWERLGSAVRCLPAEAHDRLVAQISHLPQLATYALVSAADGDALPLAGRGFVDTTRIAASAEVKVIVPIRAARGCPSMRCPYATAI